MTDHPEIAHALRAFVATIEATGGGVRFRDGARHAPVVDEDWIDLGEAYLNACHALGVEPRIAAEIDPAPDEPDAPRGQGHATGDRAGGPDPDALVDAAIEHGADCGELEVALDDLRTLFRAAYARLDDRGRRHFLDDPALRDLAEAPEYEGLLHAPEGTP